MKPNLICHTYKKTMHRKGEVSSILFVIKLFSQGKYNRVIAAFKDYPQLFWQLTFDDLKTKNNRPRFACPQAFKFACPQALKAV